MIYAMRLNDMLNLIRIKSMIIIMIILSLILMVGCASIPKRAEYKPLPPLENGSSRVYFSTGCWQIFGGEDCRGVSLPFNTPILINNRTVGIASENEFIIIDFLPGTYEGYCIPAQRDKNFTEKRQLMLKAGETRYYSCNMAQKGAGMFFGLIGALVSDYLTKTFLDEQKVIPSGVLVSYKKFSDPSQENVEKKEGFKCASD